jgi:hypothetical protein
MPSTTKTIPVGISHEGAVDFSIFFDSILSILIRTIAFEIGSNLRLQNKQMAGTLSAFLLIFNSILLQINKLKLRKQMSNHIRFKSRVLKLVMVCSSFLFLFSCGDKEKDVPPKVAISPGNMVLICNEGNFRWGNATVGLLNLSNKQWNEDAFKSVNNRGLGDVLQSASFWGNAWFLVVNNSAKIEVVNSSDFSAQKTIMGFVSPRFLLPINETKAYVSDIYARKIWILNSSSNLPVGSIPFAGWSEEMLVHGNFAWVVCRNKPKVFLINTKNDKLEDSVSLSGNATSIALSKSGKIWVGFDSSSTTNSGLALINPTSKTVERVLFSNEKNFYPSYFQSSATKDSLFFLQNGVFMIRENERNFPTKNFAQGLTGNWYGMGFDSKRREIYLSDAKDYQQKSRIIKINIEANTKVELTGGIISSRFYFW